MAYQVFDFVGNIVHQAFGIFQANHITGIVLADINPPALGVGKTTDPFEVVVVP
jgi:hypothetical protein